ncbi:hypothetical protein LQ567_10730 [Niabella pedocola]|uniref:Uncharacterized protein n=1 Tax=Niabella pedocola TaxID=1752077 RepID=A0ABS8PQW2_9BACT|nr:hypothetical protein [Niabella pedocola]MCD2423235.1 hypothetical protein [Niabella pedocola]
MFTLCCTAGAELVIPLIAMLFPVIPKPQRFVPTYSILPALYRIGRQSLYSVWSLTYHRYDLSYDRFQVHPGPLKTGLHPYSNP